MLFLWASLSLPQLHSSAYFTDLASSFLPCLGLIYCRLWARWCCGYRIISSFHFMLFKWFIKSTSLGKHFANKILPNRKQGKRWRLNWVGEGEREKWGNILLLNWFFSRLSNTYIYIAALFKHVLWSAKDINYHLEIFHKSKRLHPWKVERLFKRFSVEKGIGNFEKF